MASIPAGAVPYPRRGSIDWAALSPFVLFVAAIVLRTPHFGDPAYGIDEEFYLVAGDRLLHGALPYVDIWDRKPVGLFLLYAAIRCLGGAGIWQYQIVASLFAAATAWTIARVARPAAGGFGAVAAGLAYLVWIETVEGGGGQAPVFYNLLVALAAERVLAAGGRYEDAVFRRDGQWAMLLVGLAIQIKYTVVCEGLYFGVVLAWWSGRRLTPARALAHVTRLAAIALAPTLAALLAYVAMGEGHAFWFANFVSIFARAPSDSAGVQTRLGQIALQFLPFALCWIGSLYEQRHDERLAQRRLVCFVYGWLGAALAGFASVGTFYVHYALPLFVPAAIAAAPIFRRRPIGPVMAALLLWLPLSHLDFPDVRTTLEHRRAVAQLSALIPNDASRRCLQLFDGPPILYLTTHACLASRYPFPHHLIAAKEAGALGIDRAAAIGTLFTKKPVIVLGERSYAPEPSIEALVRGTLAKDYRLAGKVILDERPIEVFVPR